MAIAQIIFTQKLADEMALVDALPDKLRGDALDLQHAAAFLRRVRIVSGTNTAVTKNYASSSSRPGPGRSWVRENRLNLLQRNLALYRKIVSSVAEHSPEALLLVVSNPVAVLTYVAWRLSGLPASRVIVSCTNLDSSRFKFLIAKHLDVNARDVQVNNSLNPESIATTRRWRRGSMYLSLTGLTM